MRAALVADALARAAGALEGEGGEGGEGGEESEAGRDDARDEQKQSRPRDLVAALGALADAVPPPTLVGACLGYPRVYSWSKAGDVAAAARALSSETLRVYAVYARFRGVEKNGTTRRVCGFTVPAREAWEEGAGSRNEASPSSESRSNRFEAEDEDEAVMSVDGDARAWLEAMRERAAAGGTCGRISSSESRRAARDPWRVIPQIIPQITRVSFRNCLRRVSWAPSRLALEPASAAALGPRLRRRRRRRRAVRLAEQRRRERRLPLTRRRRAATPTPDLSAVPSPDLPDPGTVSAAVDVSVPATI